MTLKPCPFCGSSNISEHFKTVDGQDQPGCVECNATTDHDWNDRAGGMSEATARAVLEDVLVNDLLMPGDEVWLTEDDGSIHIVGLYSADQLEAMAWWMRNHPKEQ